MVLTHIFSDSFGPRGWRSVLVKKEAVLQIVPAPRTNEANVMLQLIKNRINHKGRAFAFTVRSKVFHLETRVSLA